VLELLSIYMRSRGDGWITHTSPYGIGRMDVRGGTNRERRRH